ncbi:MAG: hypothetical protein M3268_05525 [Acidobacteriota bacterium]|nr:hypothetical protein [Acidobacteriota bacterium]
MKRRAPQRLSSPDQSKSEGRRAFLPANFRGLLLDLAVFAFNVFLVRFATRRVGGLLSSAFLRDDARASRTLLYVVSAACAAQLVGAWLKRRPLQARLLARGEGGVTPFLGCLLILQLALTLVTAAGIMALASAESTAGLTVLTVFLSLIPTLLVARAMSPYKKPPEPDWRNSRAVELFADLCLFAYLLVNLAIWNTVTSGSNVRAAGVGDLFERGLGFVLVSPVILLFYLPPRLLFLVEDYKYPATWISMTLAVAPVAYRLIVGSPLKTDW